MSAGEIERPPHYGEGPETRTEQGEAGPGYEDYPTAADIGFEGAEPADTFEAVEVAVISVPPTATILTAFSARTVHIVNDRWSQILGENKNRTRAVVRNRTGGLDVFLSESGTGNAAFGFLLSPGNELEMTHNSEMWARCTGADEVDVSVLSEFVIDE